MLRLRQVLIGFWVIISADFFATALYAQDHLDGLRSYLQILQKSSAVWPEQLEALEQQMVRHQLKIGELALIDAIRQVDVMRQITTTGIMENDPSDLAYYKVSKARLSLTLARSGVTRAVTAVSGAANPSHELLEELLALTDAMDQSLAIEVPAMPTNEVR